MNAAAEMPRYKSHKKVWALRIAALEINEDRSAKIAPADAGYAAFTTLPGWADRFHGTDEDTGYFVQYEGGYTSWSPTDAFEGGYSPLQSEQETEQPDRPDRKVLAYLVSDMMVPRTASLHGSGVQPSSLNDKTEWLYPASRADDAKSAARTLNGTLTPLVAA